MTWPFENDTSAIVKKLANRNLKADLCIMLTVRRPAKLASKVTPIEAIRYSAGNEEVIAKSTKKLSRSLSGTRLALINFSRNKRKTILTIASLGICGILLMASSAYFNSIDPVNVARGVFPYGQVRIELGDYGSQSHSSEEFVALQRENPLSPNLMSQFAAIDGVKEMRVYSGTVLNVITPTEYENPFLADAFSADWQALLAFAYVWFTSLREPLAKTAYQDIWINFTGLFIVLSVANTIVGICKKKRERK